MSHTSDAAAREAALQRAVTVWIVSGLVFLLLPGTFLGVWNLVSISAQHTAGRIDPAWIQAHGHAQIFGWLGSFILGIGFYSLSKMAGLGRFPIRRVWTSWFLWTAGVLLRWLTSVYLLAWRVALPVSAALELAGFLTFFVTVSRHSREHEPSAKTEASRGVWVRLVVAGTLGFLGSLLANLAATVQSSIAGITPAIPHAADQRLLAIFTWTFLVVTVWGFNARWLPVFLGLPEPRGRLLMAALGIDLAAAGAALLGHWIVATSLFLIAAVCATEALRVFHHSVQPPKTQGVHWSFPWFVRAAYGWLLASALIALAAAVGDKAGGLWGASRHALTVGFLSTMVFAVGQRVLPAFCGMRVLFSPRLMFLTLASLNLGCLLRVCSEIGAYESYLPGLWPLLPFSAVTEMAAVTVFAVNLLVTFRQAPPHLQLVRLAA
jgi:hypothetical protein